MPDIVLKVVSQNPVIRQFKAGEDTRMIGS